MRFLTRIALTLCISWNLSFVCAAQDDDEITSVQWYEGFFKQKNQMQIDKVLKQYDDKLLGAIEIQDKAEQAKVFLELGLIHLNRTADYEKAMDYFIKSLALHDSLSLSEYRIFNYLAIARAFEKVRDYYKSAQFLEETLTLSSKLGNPDVHVLVLNEVGRVNALLGKLEDAQESYNEVLTYKDKVSSRKVEADALSNLAHLFTEQGQFSKALDFHKQSLAIRRLMGDRVEEAVVLNDIGEVYYLLKNEERAMANHVAALEINQSLNNDLGIAQAYISIGVLYYQKKNYDRAIANLELGLKAAKEASPQPQEQLRKSYEYLSLLYKANGAFNKALDYSEELILINDFIQSERSERQLLETQNRYVIEKKESQIENLESVRKQREAELAEQKQFRNLLFVVIGFGAVVAALIFYMYLLKRKSNKVLQAANAQIEKQNIELQSLNATKDKFFSILGHDLKGPLNSLTSFSQLLINYFDSLSKEEIQTLAKDLDKSLKNLFALLNNLLEWARSQTGNINFTPESFDITEVLEQNRELLATQASVKEITILQERTESLMVKAHVHSVTTVIRNLIANSIKFTQKGGLIKLNATTNSKEVVISIADTGIGMSEEVMNKLFRLDSKHSTLGTAQEKGTGLGLILCKDFVEKNGGKLWVESEVGKGSVFYFTLPT